MIEVIEEVQGQSEQLSEILPQSKICEWTGGGTHW